MALVILIKNTYTLWGRKRFLLPVTYFPTNLVYPFDILSDESNIPFYFTSNGYKYMTRISLKGAEPVPNVTVGLSSVATSASEVKFQTINLFTIEKKNSSQGVVL